MDGPTPMSATCAAELNRNHVTYALLRYVGAYGHLCGFSISDRDRSAHTYLYPTGNSHHLDFQRKAERGPPSLRYALYILARQVLWSSKSSVDQSAP